MTSLGKGHRWFAATYDLLNAALEGKAFRDLRRWTVGGARGRVLEIGVGTGASLPFYPRDQRIVAVEPDPYMRRKAQRRATQLGLDVDLHPYSAEGLTFPDASFDTVMSTLVLCTVQDQLGSLREVRRVLKAGGELRFIEHVRAGGFLGPILDLISPVWQWFGGGCHPNRKTLEALEAEGFEVLELRRRRFLLLPFIAGVARAKT